VLVALGDQSGFHVLPRRWVVERSIAWLGRSRRLSKDYERRPATSEALIYLAGIRLLLTRLTRFISPSHTPSNRLWAFPPHTLSPMGRWCSVYLAQTPRRRRAH
jgi:DDE family transposase